MKKARVYFLNEVTLRIGFINRFDDIFETGSSQMIVYGVCEMALLPWLYEPSLFCFSLILKRRNSSAKVAFSSKEISFECLSWDGNTVHRSSAQRARGKTLVDVT